MDPHNLIHSLAQDTETPRPLWSVGQRVAVGASVGAMAALIVSSLAEWHPQALQLLTQPRAVLESLVLASLWLLASYAALTLAVPGRVVSSRLRWSIIALVLSWLALVVERGVAEFIGTGAVFPVSWRGLKCCAWLIATAGLPAAIWIYLVVRGAPLQGRQIGAYALLSAGALGALCGQFTCWYYHALHVLIWHAAPVLLLTLLGALLGRWVRWR